MPLGLIVMQKINVIIIINLYMLVMLYHAEYWTQCQNYPLYSSPVTAVAIASSNLWQ